MPIERYAAALPVRIRAVREGEHEQARRAWARAHPDTVVTMSNTMWPPSSDVAIWVMALLGEQMAGVAWVHQDLTDSQWTLADVSVDPAYRRCGVGRALAAWVQQTAQDRGPTTIYVHPEARSAPDRQWARRRGLVEYGAEGLLPHYRLDIDRAPKPGTGAITTYARPAAELSDVYEIYREAWQDLPGAEADPESRESCLEHWQRLISEGGAVLVAELAGEIVGISTCLRGVEGPVGAVGLTGTARSSRRRGVGTALKAAQVEWARERGLSHLVAAIDEEHHAMVALATSMGWQRQELVGFTDPVD